MNHNWSDYFDVSSEYWKKVEKIYEESEHFPKKVVKYRNLHHKFPRSFSKKDGVDIDNDDDNLVSLSLSDHFLVHYYLWKCCKKGYRNLMALAFNFMRKKAIKYASDETIEELAKDYANVMEDVSNIHSEIGKRVTSSKKWRAAMSKVDRFKVNKKSRETTKMRYSAEELKEINTSKANFCRGKTYEEIYGQDRAKELKESRANSNRKRGCSEETKRKISEAKKGSTPSNKGKQSSEETKRKISEGLKDVKEAYKKSGRKDWCQFRKEWAKSHNELKMVEFSNDQY